MPFIPTEENDKDTSYLLTDTEDLKLMYDYSGISFDALLELDFLTYKLLFKDAFINKLKQSDKGQEILENSYLLQQTKPNRKALRENLNKC